MFSDLREEMENEAVAQAVAKRDLWIETMTGETAEKIAAHFRLSGKADDLPLLLKKTARIHLEPTDGDVELRYPAPRDWPKEIQDKVMAKLMADLEIRLRKILFTAETKPIA